MTYPGSTTVFRQIGLATSRAFYSGLIALSAMALLYVGPVSAQHTIGQQEGIQLAQSSETEFTLQERQMAQLALNALGWDVGIADGVLGESSRAGIRQFQLSIGQAPTGLLTRGQFAILRDAHQRLASQTGGSIERPPSPQELRELQVGLKALGWYTGQIDGVIGNGTMQAIGSFLRNEGLNPQSVSTAETIAMVRQRAQAIAAVAQGSVPADPVSGCAQAGSATRQTICGSEPLAMLERVMGEALDKAVSRTPWAGREKLKQDQVDWLQFRDSICQADQTCILKALVGRITLLAPGQFNQIVQLAQNEGFLTSAIQTTHQTATVGSFTQAPPPTSNPAILALATELGIPVKNGHLVVKHPQMFVAPEPEVIAPDQAPTDAMAWPRLEMLSYIGRDPALFTQDGVFVSVAATMLQGAEFDAFFPDRGALNRALAYGGPAEWNAYDAHPFGDEFAYPEKRQQFFDTIFPRLQARAPQWPLPILHVVPFALGSYDMERGAFPLSIVLAAGQSSLHFASFASDDKTVATPIASSDLIEVLPQWLEMPADQARLLRAEKPQDPHVFLGWYADLDWRADVQAPAVSADRNVPAPRTPRGRATIKHVALYADAQMTKPLVIFDPATFGKPQQKVPAAAQSAVLADGTIDIARIRTASDVLLLRHAADVAAEVYPGEFARDLVGNAREATQADEFDREEVQQRLLADFMAIPTDELWLQTTVSAGEYSAATGGFDLTAVRPNFGYAGVQNPYRARIQVTFLDPVNLSALPVREDVARHIMKMNDRRIKLFLRVEMEKAGTSAGQPVSMFLRPRTLVYAAPDPQTGEDVVLAVQPFASEPKSSAGPAATESFAGQRLPFTVATAGLLFAQTLDPGQRGLFYERLMPVIWQAERDGFAPPGAPFFPAGTPVPVGGVAQSFLGEFIQWAEAKAAALTGANYNLETTARQFVHDSCTAGNPVQANFQYADSDLGRSLQIPDVDAARKQAQILPAPVLLEREVLFYTARLDRPGDVCRLSDWNLFAEITKAAAWTTASPNVVSLRRSISARLTGIDTMPGKEPFPDVVFRFDAIETIFEEVTPEGPGQEFARLAATGPTQAQIAAEKAAEDARAPYRPAYDTWTGTYQCQGVTSARMNMDFAFPAADRVGAISQRYFNPIQGLSSGGAIPSQSDLQYAVSDIAVLHRPDAGALLSNEKCTSVLQFGTTSLVPRSGIDTFSLFLIDLDAVRAIDTDVGNGAPAEENDGEIKL